MKEPRRPLRAVGAFRCEAAMSPDTDGGLDGFRVFAYPNDHAVYSRIGSGLESVEPHLVGTPLLLPAGQQGAVTFRRKVCLKVGPDDVLGRSVPVDHDPRGFPTEHLFHRGWSSSCCWRSDRSGQLLVASRRPCHVPNGETGQDHDYRYENGTEYLGPIITDCRDEVGEPVAEIVPVLHCRDDDDPDEQRSDQSEHRHGELAVLPGFPNEDQEADHHRHADEQKDVLLLIAGCHLCLPVH